MGAVLSVIGLFSGSFLGLILRLVFSYTGKPLLITNDYHKKLFTLMTASCISNFLMVYLHSINYANMLSESGSSQNEKTMIMIGQISAFANILMMIYMINK